MNSVIENLNQLGGQLWQFAWPMLWQSSLLIGLVLALDFLLARKIRASVRYALWLAVLVKLLLPPTFALPTGAAWWLFHAPPPVKTPAIRNFTVTYDTTPLADYVPPSIALPPPAPPKLDGAGWALLATGTVSAALLLWLMIRWWQVARMVRGASVSEELAGLIESVRQQAGLRSRIHLKLVEGRMSPAVCGLFRPVILLPRTLAENLSAVQLRAVLLHEVFHLRRLDVWVNCAQALLQIVYWWHPLLWFANARIRRLREEAVDDAVMLALRDEADSYAPTLLEVAKLAFRRPLLSLGLVGIMESRSALRQRIERLVDFRAPRKAGLTFASLCGICVFSAVALPMGEGPLRGKGNEALLQNQTNATFEGDSNLTPAERDRLAESTKTAIAELQQQFASGKGETRRLALLNFEMLPLFKNGVAGNPTLGEALPILIQATKDENYLVRHAAVVALWQIKSSDQKVVEALGDLLNTETNLGTLTTATSVLKEMGAPAAFAVPDIIQVLEQRKPDGTLISAANNQVNPNIPLGTALRRAAIEALGNIGPAAQGAIPVLRHLLLNDTGEFAMGDHVFSAKALWQITGETNESLPVLINALEKDKSFWAADILGLMGSDAKAAIPALQNVIQSGPEYVRQRSVFALLMIEPEVPSPIALPDLASPKSSANDEKSLALVAAKATEYRTNSLADLQARYLEESNQIDQARLDLEQLRKSYSTNDQPYLDELHNLEHMHDFHMRLFTKIELVKLEKTMQAGSANSLVKSHLNIDWNNDYTLTVAKRNGNFLQGVEVSGIQPNGEQIAMQADKADLAPGSIAIRCLAGFGSQVQATVITCEDCPVFCPPDHDFPFPVRNVVLTRLPLCWARVKLRYEHGAAYIDRG